MSDFLVRPLSELEQQRLLLKLYGLLDQQVQSYHKSRHMGQNSSVPTELAQELMASVEYTLGLVGGADPNGNLGERLHLGQEILEEKLQKAIQRLDLVVATAPSWQTQCRWEAIVSLRRYLEIYDYRHLAHRSLECLFYPILIPVPEGLQGIDQAQFYLTVLWEENQIMAQFSDKVLEPLWERLPADALNQCDQVILNAIGQAMVGGGLEKIVFTEGQWGQLEGLSAEEFVQRWTKAVQTLPLGEYGVLAAKQMLPQGIAAQESQNLRAIFL